MCTSIIKNGNKTIVGFMTTDMHQKAATVVGGFLEEIM